jgi:Protein of unknown function (DUF3365)
MPKHAHGLNPVTAGAAPLRWTVRDGVFGFLGRRLLALVAAAVFAWTGCRQRQATTRGEVQPAVTFTPQELTDALHAVLAAERRVYALEIVQRLSADEKIIPTSEHWKENRALPVPAQMLRLSSQTVQQEGAEFHYVLRSLWPVNPKNAPETATERIGLEYVAQHPETNYYAQEMLGGRRYFTAIYADRALASSCVDCHDHHPASPKRDFKIGEVMGGLVVRVPLEF